MIYHEKTFTGKTHAQLQACLSRFVLFSFLCSAPLLVSVANAQVGNSGLSYQGRILDPYGNPIVGTIPFKIQIRTPDNDCLMYEETKNVDVVNGVFDITINDGVTVPDHPGVGLDKIFGNYGTFTFAPSDCTTLESYTPNTDDGRKLAVQFYINGAWEAIPSQMINHIPMAIESKQVGGFTSASLVRVAESDGTLDSVSPLNNAQYTQLLSLIAGTSNQYLVSGTGGTVIPSVSSSPSTTAGNIWFDPTTHTLDYYNGTAAQVLGTSGGSVTAVNAGTGIVTSPAGGITGSGTVSLSTVGTGGTGTKLTFDIYGRITATSSLIETDLPTILTAGKVSGGAITSGTIAGSTAINTTGNITTTGSITAGAATIAAESLNDLYVSANGYQVHLSAPALASSYSLKLPANTLASDAGKVLSVDSTGQLSWLSPATGSVTSLTGDVTSTGTGSVTTTIAPGVVTYSKIQNVSGNNILLGRATSGAGSVQEITLGTGLSLSGTTLNNTATDSFAALPCGNGYLPEHLSGVWTCVAAGSTNVNTTLVERDASGNFDASVITANGLVLNNSGSLVTLQNPVGSSYTLTLPSSVGSSGQILSTTGSGNLNWSTLPTSSAPSGAAGGDLSGTYPNPTVATVGTSTAAQIHSAEVAANGATAANSAGKIVARDGSGNFTANQASLSQVTLKDSGSNSVSLSAPNVLTSSYSLKWPASAASTNGLVLASDTSGNLTWVNPSSGSVTSVGLSLPSIFNVTNSPITSSGSLTASLASETQNQVLAAPLSGNGAPSFRNLNISDVKSSVSGNFLTGTTCSAGQALSYSAVSDTISCQTVAASATSLSGVVPVANGGTNSSTALNNNSIMISSGGAIVEAPALTNGQLLIGSTGLSPVAATLTAGTGVTVTNTAGTITIASTGVQTVTGSTLSSGKVWVGDGSNTAQPVTLAGDVTTTNAGVTAVASVGTSTAANIHSAEIAANAATSANTASTIVARDPSGNFSAGTASLTSASASTIIYKDSGSNSVTIEAPATVATSYVLKLPTAVAGTAGQVLASDTSGNLSWFSLPAASAPSGAAGGDLSGTYPNPTVATVGTSTAANIHLADVLANAATNLDTASTIVKRDASGNFAAGGISASAISIGTPSGVGELNLAAGSSTVAPLILAAGTNLTTAVAGAVEFDGTNLYYTDSTATRHALATSASATQWTTAGSNIYYSTGNVGIGTTITTADLNIKAGTATVAPLLLTPGTNLTTPLVGAVEFDGTNLFYTDSTATRRTLSTSSNTSSFTGVSSIANSAGNMTLAPQASTGAVLVNSGTPSTSSATGALQITGGEGLTGDLFAGASINAATSLSAGTSLTVPQIYGTAGASGNIKIDGTSNAAKGNVLLATVGGNVGIGTTTPSAYLQIAAGTTAAGTAPIKLTAGVNLTTPENGALEFDGTSLFLTTGGVRKTIPATTTSNDFSNVGSITGSGALTVAAGGTNQNLTLAGTGTGSVTTSFPLTVTNATASTSTSTGAETISGGLGVSGNINAGILAAASGSATAPSHTFTSDLASGLWQPAYSTLAWSTAGAERMRLTSSGLIGIGTTTPSVTLDMNGKTDAVRLPAGTTAQEPTGGAGMIRYNTSNNAIEFYNSSTSAWVTLGATSGSQTFAGNDTFSGDVSITGPSTGLSVTNAETIGTTLGVTGLTTLTGGFTSAGTAAVTNTTASTSTTTGAETIAGGLGVAGAANIGTSVTSPLIYGSSASNGTLTLAGTSNATPGNILLNTSGGNVGIGTTTPASAFDLNGALSVRGMAAPSTSPAGQGRIYFDSTSNQFMISQNNGAYAALATTSGGQTVSGNETFSGDITASGAGTGLAVSNAATVGTTLGVTGLTTLTGGFTSAGTGVITNTTASTSTTTGAATVAGGLGVAGTVNAGILAAASGTAALPSHTFTSDLASGLWSPATSAVALSTAGVERMRVTPSGSVGIGTTTPAGLLGLYSAATTGTILNLQNADTGGHSYNIASTGSANTPGAGTLNFYDVSNSISRLLISSTGNIGIGTTVPTAVLNIKAGTSTLAPLQLTSGTNLTTPLSGAIEYDGTNLYYTDSTATRRTLASTSVVSGSYLPLTGGTMTGALVNNTSSTSAALAVTQSSTGPAATFQGGNVGIGTTAPATALDLNGALSVRGMAAPSTSPAGQGRIYFDSTSNQFMISQNNGAYAALATTSGGQTVSGNETFSGDITVSGAGTGLAVSNAATVGTTLGVTGLTTLTGGFTSAGTAAVTNTTASTSTTTGAETVAGGLGVAGTVNAGILAGASGTAALPSHTFTSDLASGLWSPATSAVALSTAGVERMRVTSSGNVGIGTTSPAAKLQVGLAPTASANYPLFALGSGAFDGATSGYYVGNANGTAIGANLASGYAGDLVNLEIAGVSKFKVDSSGNVTTSGTTNTSGATTTSGNFSQTGSATFSTGTGAVSLNGPVTDSSTLSVTGATTLAGLTDSGVESLANATASTSSTTGAVKISGGLGIVGDIFSGATINAATSMMAPQIYGSTAASGTLKVDGTSNATKGYLLLNSTGGNVGIGTTTPGTALDVSGALSVRGMVAPSTSPAGQGRIYFDSTSNQFMISQNNGAYAALATTSGGQTVSGNETFSGDVTMSGSGTGLAVSNAATVGTTLGVTGLTTLTGGLTSAGTAAITNITASTSTTTGAETVSGGLGVAGTINAGILAAGSGTAALPSFTFTSDLASGLWSPATSAVALSTAGAERVRVTSTGNVGIGTTSPASSLQVKGQITNVVSTYSSSFTCGTTTLDFSTSNFIRFSPSNTIAAGSCTITLANLVAGGSYTLVITGNASTNAVTYSFGGYTNKFLPQNAATTATQDTIYNFLYDGTSVYVTWAGGYY